MNVTDINLLYIFTGFAFLIFLLYKLVSYVLKEEVNEHKKSNNSVLKKSKITSVPISNSSSSHPGYINSRLSKVGHSSLLAERTNSLSKYFEPFYGKSLKGDKYLWKELKEEAKQYKTPDNASDFEIALVELFVSIVGHEPQAGKEYLIERYNLENVAGEYVSSDYWLAYFEIITLDYLEDKEKQLTIKSGTAATPVEKDVITYFYKVTEESSNYSESIPEAFFSGNLLKQKVDAADWYNRRRKTLEMKLMFVPNVYNKQPSVKVKLFLVQQIGNKQKEYLLINEHGVRNNENTLFEGIILDSLGFNKKSDPYKDNHTSISKNSYLDPNQSVKETKEYRPTIKNKTKYVYITEHKELEDTHEKYYYSILKSSLTNKDISKALATAAKSYLTDRGRYLGSLN